MSVLDMFGKESVEFVVKGPVLLHIDEALENVSGCSYIDISFPHPSKVGELLFRNYYTATISILVQKETELSTGAKTFSPWILAINRKQLMPTPHFENGSQDVFSISATESVTAWENLINMRIFLRQPSPVWNNFRLDEINVFVSLPRLSTAKLPTDTMNQPRVNKLLDWLKRQTVSALEWTPAKDGKVHGSNLLTPSSAAKESEKLSCPYEINKLPQT